MRCRCFLVVFGCFVTTENVPSLAEEKTFAARMLDVMADPAYLAPRDPVPVEDPPKLPELPLHLRFEQSWQRGKNCGPVALFFLLALNGKTVALNDVLAKVPVNDDGSSLADLQAAAQYFGLDTDIVRLTPDGFADLPCPSIIHWTTVTSEPQLGNHFDVFLGYQPALGCDVIDTTNGRVAAIAQAVAITRFSGYALIARKPYAWATLLLEWSLAVTWSANLVLAGVLVARRVRH